MSRALRLRVAVDPRRLLRGLGRGARRRVGAAAAADHAMLVRDQVDREGHLGNLPVLDVLLADLLALQRADRRGPGGAAERPGDRRGPTAAGSSTWSTGGWPRCADPTVPQPDEAQARTVEPCTPHPCKSPR